MNGQVQYDGTYAALSTITIDGGAGHDTIDIEDIPPGISVTTIEGDTGAVNVGKAGSLLHILGTLWVTNPSSYTALTLDDSADIFARTAVVGTFPSDPNWGYIAGLTPENINYRYSDTSSLTIDTSAIDGNVVGVWENGVTTNLIGDAATTVNIGDGLVGVQSILGTLNIDNPQALTAINIDDSADTSARTTIMGTYTPAGDTNWGYITGLAQYANINYEYADTSSVTINGSKAKGNVIGVWENGVTTNLIGNGTATVNIGDGLVGVQSILGTINIDNPTSYTTVNIDDSADELARTTTMGTFTPPGDSPWGYITGLSQYANINYEYADTSSVTINGSRAEGNVIGVWENGVTTNLISNGTATVNIGDGLVGVQSILGAISIQNPPLYTAVHIDDSADRSHHAGVTITEAEITGLAPATISYKQDDLDALTIDGGSGGNVYTVANTPTNVHLVLTTTLNSGAGDDTVDVLATAGPLVVKTGAGSNVVNVGDTTNRLDSIEGTVTVDGTGGGAALNINDQAPSRSPTIRSPPAPSRAPGRPRSTTVPWRPWCSTRASPATRPTCRTPPSGPP